MSRPKADPPLAGIVKFICVGTPPKEDGSPDMTAYWSVIDEMRMTATAPSPLQELVLSLSKEEGRGEVYIINKSTVPVGTARKAQEKLGNAFAVISMPEFLREGKAIHDFKNPDRVVVGCRDVVAQRLTGDAPSARLYTDRTPLLHKEGVGGGILSDVLKIFSCPILSMSWESAELTKYAANAFLATKISFINEIARLCEKVGANVDDIAQGIGHDPRIGTAFLKAGIGYGGSCFPKDVRALSALACANDYEFELLKATIEVNQSQKEFVLKKMVETLRWSVSHEMSQSDVSTTVAILGLAFKGDTDDIRESPAMWLIQELVKKGVHIQCYDPQAMDNARVFVETHRWCVSDHHTLGDAPTERLYTGRPLVFMSDSPEQCLKNADMVVIATEWEEFKNLDWKALKELVKTPVIVDAKNLLDKDELETIGWRYKGVGR